MAAEENFSNIVELLETKSGYEDICSIKPDYLSKASIKMIILFTFLFSIEFMFFFVCVVPYLRIIELVFLLIL
jgi:hypothetical protein